MINKRNIISTSLMILCFSILMAHNLHAQRAEASSSQAVEEPVSENHNADNLEYRSRISQDYINKFSSMSRTLEIRTEEYESTNYRLDAVKKRSKSVQEKKQQALFDENIQSLKLSLSALDDEIKLLKKALRILQEYKSDSEAQKNKVLFEVTKIEMKIDEIKQQYDNDRLENLIEAVDVDERSVYSNPPKDDCNIVFNGIDAVTKKPKVEVQKEFLFGYTHPKLRSYFKDKFFLNCYAKMVQLDKKYYLWLYINIASKDAIRNYGRIEQNSTLKFELLDGEIIYAQNAQNSYGQLEAYTGNTNYEVILPLDKSKYKLLSKGEIDRIGIMWTSGYEQYEIYNVDIIKNQIECLNLE